MSYPKVKRYFPAGIGAAGHLGALDISDADDTSVFTWVPQDDVIIYGFGGVVTEAMGTQTTTEGVCSLEVDGVEQSSFESTPSAAIGTEAKGSDFRPIKVTAGTPIELVVKTQAVGGTIVGEYAGFVDCEFFPDHDAV